MSASEAQGFFSKNMNIYDHALENYEKYNLYRGLWNLARAIVDIEHDLTTIKNNIDNLMSQR